MLGTDVCRAAADHEVVSLDHGALDVTDAVAVADVFGQASPDAVINCAAWTDVDGAESHLDEALAANRDGAANVARAAAGVGAWTIHVSSDYVFDGTKSDPYVERDPVNPLSAYGRSKLMGELAVVHAAPESNTIVRSSWLFGNAGHCFPKTILRLASERDELTVVDDQVGCPTFTGHLARVLVELAATRRLRGVVHVAAAGQCSWFEFASAIVAAAGAGAEVKPGKTADLARPAPRPAYSVLRSERSDSPELPDWRHGLEQFMALEVPVT
jgi:dTDP-4-dehydrorhamnose reductase